MDPRLLSIAANPSAALRRFARLAAPALLAAVVLGAPAAAQYVLVWEDDFLGDTLDPTKWQPQIGTGCPSLCGWGNNELQFYRAENAVVAGGVLTITAKEESFAGQQYTSARIRTANLGDWEGGRFEMRAKLPTGQGMWPAFWMLPTDSVYGVWAASGEIDIMEMVGHEPERVLGSIHYGGTSPANVFSNGAYTLSSGTFHDDFHTFALEWDEFEMRWYVDDILYSTKTSWWSTGGAYPAPFDQRFHLLLNLAVGGIWPGNPDGTTVFPQHFLIDYVRVYQEPDFDTCVTVFDDMDHGNPFGNGYFEFSAPTAGGGISPNLLDLPPVQGGTASIAAGWAGAPGYYGGFGRTSPRDLSSATHFEMWVLPDAGQAYEISINLVDDDNGDDVVPSTPDGADDEFQASVFVGAPGSGADLVSGGGWQRVVIPFTDFVDDNSFHFGGNGIFDPTPTSAGGNGQLVNVVIALSSSSGSPITFRTDYWTFTRRTGFLVGRVWSDLDGDGFDDGEPGLPGVTVEAFDPALGTVVATSVTGSNGQYSLNDLVGASYVVRVDASTLPPGPVATYDPDGVATPNEFVQVLACEQVLFDLDFGFAPPAPVNYCSGLPNSAGPGSSISSSGSVSIAAQDFVIEETGGIPNGFGIFFFGPDEVDVPFGDGRRCVGGQIFRIQPPQQADANGDAARAVDFTTVPGDNVTPGSTWNFQYWYRDPPGGPAGFNLSDGLAVTFWP